MDTATFTMGKILIIGDSWACGEWDFEQKLAHEGTTHYIRDAGYEITSLAKGSASNSKQLDKLEDHRDTDICIWFLTDPLREVVQQPTTLQDYHDIRKRLLEKSFERMNKILPNAQIWLIGGVCRVPDWVAEKYPSWKIVVEDLRAWLLSDDTHIDTLCRDWQYPDCELDLLEYHEQQEKLITKHRIRSDRGTDTKEHRLFWPDRVHPNRHGHRILTDELILPMLEEAKA